MEEDKEIVQGIGQDIDKLINKKLDAYYKEKEAQETVQPQKRVRPEVLSVHKRKRQGMYHVPKYRKFTKRTLRTP